MFYVRNQELNKKKSLIEYCGYGVAMENAVDEVKERANYITLSNNDNGIAYCLKQLEEKGLI